jgi:N-acetylglutamate synthase
MDIQEMKIEDYEQIIALWEATEGIGLSDADNKENIASYLTRNSGSSFVAGENNMIVGAVLCGHDGRRGYLHHLAVQPEFRRNGIGRVLVDRALAKLEEAGIGKCHLFIYNSNVSGVSFWQSQGWELRNDIGIMSMMIN